MSYSLGASATEQARLIRQVELYGDTAGLSFGSESVCELGCGVGANLWIAQQNNPHLYTGIDNSTEQLRAARRRADSLGCENVELLERAADNTLLDSGRYDASFCRLLLIHQPDAARIVREMVRITRPGGRVIALESHGPGYYCTPGKANLMKCFHARTRFAYGEGRGSPEVALNLFPLWVNAGLQEVRVRPHVITATGAQPTRAQQFLNHWIQILEPVSEQLVAHGLITSAELALAHQEARIVTPDLFICHTMWQAEGRKNHSVNS